MTKAKKTMTSLPSNSKSSAGFELLAAPVQRWLWNKNWQSLRPIQARAIETILADERDVIISASTAGGKTEAAFLPLISQVLQAPNTSGFDLVYVGPLRALINDQFARLQELCAETELPVYPWHGDIAQGIKARARQEPRGVLLITPESLEALFVLRGQEIARLFANTRTIVIDELHALLDNERGIHLRSLLTRIELASGQKKIRRIGLSATLGEMQLTRQFLRPEAPADVELIADNGKDGELKAQIRGYVQRADDKDDKEDDQKSYEAQRAIANHLFSKLRGTSNLIFAGSRRDVEYYADALRDMSEQIGVANEFFPHHGNLHREARNFLEKRLKQLDVPTTAVCTSTLELGIDIGDIECVAHIGAPLAVAALRQRLGRSGRRAGKAKVLRMYAIEQEVGAESDSWGSRLCLGLVRCIAMVELLLAKWCEPPKPGALNLSTFTHQILSVIAERGGASAQRIYKTLCQCGPFHTISKELYTQLLRQLAAHGVELIEQTPDGKLVAGRVGERLVNHYSFYAVFQTPDEYRIVADAKQLGTMPLDNRIVKVGDTIIFSGRRWCVAAIHDDNKVIEVTADRTGKPPKFSGDLPPIHDKVAAKMLQVLASTTRYAYLDAQATSLLQKARGEFTRLALQARPICDLGGSWLIATGVGTIKIETLAFVLENKGYVVEKGDRILTANGFLKVSKNDNTPPVRAVLKEIANSPPPHRDSILTGDENLKREKYHRYLGRELLLADVASSRVDLNAMPELAQTLLRGKQW